MWLQQDIEIWKKIKMQKCEKFGSLPLLARNLSDEGHIMSITDKSSLLYRYNVIDQQDIEISKNLTV